MGRGRCGFAFFIFVFGSFGLWAGWEVGSFWALVFGDKLPLLPAMSCCNGFFCWVGRPPPSPLVSLSKVGALLDSWSQINAQKPQISQKKVCNQGLAAVGVIWVHPSHHIKDLSPSSKHPSFNAKKNVETVRLG